MRCQECNYDLTGTGSDICPECGAGASPLKLLSPDSAFEALVRVIGVWLAATAVIGVLTMVVDAYMTSRIGPRSMTSTAGLAPAAIVGLYLLFFAPQIRRLCYRDRAPRAYTARAIFHLLVGLIGIWLATRGLSDIGRNVVLELLSPRPRVSLPQIASQAPRVVGGLLLVMGAGWLSRVWK